MNVSKRLSRAAKDQSNHFALSPVEKQQTVLYSIVDKREARFEDAGITLGTLLCSNPPEMSPYFRRQPASEILDRGSVRQENSSANNKPTLPASASWAGV
jgi:hypothetical protein